MQNGCKYPQNSTTSFFYNIISKILVKYRFLIRAFFIKILALQIFDACLVSILISLRSCALNRLFWFVLNDTFYSVLFTNTKSRQTFTKCNFFKSMIGTLYSTFRLKFTSFLSINFIVLSFKNLNLSVLTISSKWPISSQPPT